VFIKLGPKHASKDETELAVFKVLGEFLLAVPVLRLLRIVCNSKIFLGFFLVHSIDYGTQASIQSTNENTFYQLSLRREYIELV
jgi:hypothetical protein